MIFEQVITAQNCTVEFKGIEVGYLQNFSLNCSYNLQPIKNLHQFEAQHYAQGIAIYGAQAERGFINLEDTIFGGTVGLIGLVNMAKDVNEGLQPGSSAYDKMQAIAQAGLLINKAINFAKDTLDDIKDMLTGEKNEDLFAMFDYFDIMIKNPMIKIPNFLGINDIINKIAGGQENLIKLVNCKFNSRNMTINPSNVMVLENISVVSLELNDYVNKI